MGDKARQARNSKSVPLIILAAVVLTATGSLFLLRRESCFRHGSIEGGLLLNSAQARKLAPTTERTRETGLAAEIEMIDTRSQLKMAVARASARAEDWEGSFTTATIEQEPHQLTVESSAPSVMPRFTAPYADHYLKQWASQYQKKLTSPRFAVQAQFVVVPVGCSVPRPMFMLGAPPRQKKVKNTHVVVTNQYHNQLNYPYEINTINVMHLLYKRMAKPCVVLDMGANDGYYALLAAAYGCRVVSIEPQTLCYDRLSFAVGFNGLDDLVDLRHGAVGTSPGSLSIPVAETCNGRFQTAGGNINGETVQVPFYAADSLAAGREVYIWHVDVEGAEVDVLLSGSRILESGMVENLIIELAPQRWGKFGVSITDGAASLASVISDNYLCRDLADLSYVGSYADVTRNLLNSKYMEVWCWKDSTLASDTVIPKVFPCSPHGEGMKTIN